MALNLNTSAEEALGLTLEGPWALPAELTDPDGETNLYEGQVSSSYVLVNPDTGQPVEVEAPAVVLRISSLVRVPIFGEVWAVRIPLQPSPEAALVTHLMDKSKAPHLDATLGLITLYLKKAGQK